MPNPTSPAGPDPVRAVVPLDPGLCARPWSHDEAGQDETVAHWQALVDAGLIGNRPPCPPAVAAQREANDALFRGFAADRRRAAREGLG